MTWYEFYDRYTEWAESTLRTKISSLEDIGDGEEVVDVCVDIHDEKILAQLIRRAMKLGVKFTYDDFSVLDEIIISDSLRKEISEYSGFSAKEPMFVGELKEFNNMSDEQMSVLDEKIRLAETRVDRIAERTKKPKKRSMSVKRAITYGALIGIFKGLFFSKKAHSGHCDGNCEKCPAHYGYRYGRWYYGRGHNSGCEFGGNKGGGRLN